MTHPTHDVPPLAWCCRLCGAFVGTVDAKLRCDAPEPKDAQESERNPYE